MVLTVVNYKIVCYALSESLCIWLLPLTLGWSVKCVEINSKAEIVQLFYKVICRSIMTWYVQTEEILLDDRGCEMEGPWFKSI